MCNLVLRSIGLFYSAISCDEADYDVHESEGEAAVGVGPDGGGLKPVSFLLRQASPLKPSRSVPKNEQNEDQWEQLESRFLKLVENKSAVGDSTSTKRSCVTSLKRLKSGLFEDAPAAKEPKKLKGILKKPSSSAVGDKEKHRESWPWTLLSATADEEAKAAMKAKKTY